MRAKESIDFGRKSRRQKNSSAQADFEDVAAVCAELGVFTSPGNDPLPQRLPPRFASLAPEPRLASLATEPRLASLAPEPRLASLAAGPRLGRVSSLFSRSGTASRSSCSGVAPRFPRHASFRSRVASNSAEFLSRSIRSLFQISLSIVLEFRFLIFRFFCLIRRNILQ